MAALSGITGITIELTINGTPYPAINADETTTTAVLPKIKAGDKISGKATINLSNGDPRVAYLDETEAALHGVLKFKVPYTYTANNLAGQPVASGTYYARDGINLSTATTSDIAGWQCAEDGSVHYGSYVTGVRGDITLNAVSASGAPVLNASASPEILYATATSGDTTTITITGVTGSPQVSSISNELEQQGAIVPDNASNPTSYTLTVKIKDDPTSTMGDPIWFNDDTTANVTITDDSGAIKSVPLTLKNKYTFTVADASNSPYPQGDKDQGTSYSFDDLKGIIPASAIPAGREVVAFEEGTRIFKESDSPITLGSSTFTQRLVRLKAVLDFTCSLSDGGYGTTASPLSSQTGTSTNPYLLNYYGTTTERKIQIEINDYACGSGDLTLEIDQTQPNIANINNADMFDPISQTGNHFLLKLKDDLAKNSVYINLIKLIATDPTTGATKDVYIKVVKVGIGNKDTPDAVGDIVFTDGTAMAYTAFNNLAPAEKTTKAAAAIAVIFYAGGNAKLGGRVLGLGINSYNGTNYQGTQNDASAKGYLAYIEGLKSEPHWNGQASSIDDFISLINGDVDGSDNLSVMSSYFNTTVKTDDSEIAGKYTAFQWPKNIYPGTRSNLTGTAYTTGWYLPTLPEMLMIYKNKATVETALAACGSGVTSTIPGGEYWTFSASTCDSSNHSGNSLTLLNMTTGNPDWDDGWAGKKILAIRRFN